MVFEALTDETAVLDRPRSSKRAVPDTAVPDDTNPCHRRADDTTVFEAQSHLGGC